MSDFPRIGVSLLIPSAGRRSGEIPLGAENMVPTHLWRQLGRSPSLSMKTSDTALGEHAWQLSPMEILGGPGGEGLFVAHGWEPASHCRHWENSRLHKELHGLPGNFEI